MKEAGHGMEYWLCESVLWDQYLDINKARGKKIIIRLGFLFVLYGVAFKVFFFFVSVCPEFLELLASSLGGAPSQGY